MKLQSSTSARSQISSLSSCQRGVRSQSAHVAVDPRRCSLIRAGLACSHLCVAVQARQSSTRLSSAPLIRTWVCPVSVLSRRMLASAPHPGAGATSTLAMWCAALLEHSSIMLCLFTEAVIEEPYLTVFIASVSTFACMYSCIQKFSCLFAGHEGQRKAERCQRLPDLQACQVDGRALHGVW